MEAQDKALLLVEICARYPYGLMVRYDDKIVCVEEIHFSDSGQYFFTLKAEVKKYVGVNIERIKPYLKSMSRMTDEEKEEYMNTFCELKDELGTVIRYPSYASTDWLTAHHYDYKGLIKTGLSLEALEGMYK